MKISAYITELEKIKSEAGDIEVQTNGFNGRQEANSPKLSYTLILKGREYKPRFWNYDDEDRKGNAVCKI